MLNLAGFGPDEHQLFIQAGIEGLHDILAIGPRAVPGPARPRGAAELNWPAAGGPDGRDVVGAGPDARGGVARRAPPMAHPRGVLAALVIGIAAALVIVAIAILPFLNPVWVGFEQGRAQAAGVDRVHRRATCGPRPTRSWPTSSSGRRDFDVALDGVPVLDERERGHMRDVRGVFAALLRARAGRRGRPRRGVPAGSRPSGRARRLWRRLACAGRVIAVATVALGIVGVLFFDTAFEAVPRAVLPGRLVPVRPRHRAARPAVPGGVLGRDDDRGRGRDRRAGRRPGVARRPPGADARGQRGDVGRRRPPRGTGRRGRRADERRHPDRAACSGSRSGSRSPGSCWSRSSPSSARSRRRSRAPTLSPVVQWADRRRRRARCSSSRSSPTSSPTRSSGGGAACRRRRSCSGSSAGSRRSRSRPAGRATSS